MIKTNKKAFTLVELLAVIVILAIILVIAVPKVMSIIEDAKKATLESTAKMIASQAEKVKVQNTVLSKNEEINCEDVVKLNNIDYERCIVEFENDTAKVTIVGKGKFANLSVCNATSNNASTVKNICYETLATHIQELYENSSTRVLNGLIKDNTNDENIRYSGSDEVVKNYVEFNNKTWRIIGIFDVKTANGDNKELVKIVKNEPFKDIEGKTITMSWDSSDSTINSGYGVNEWSQADLKEMLNTYYIGETPRCIYCNDSNQSTCMNSCNDIMQISSVYKNMIETVIWNTGANDENIFNSENIIFDLLTTYNQERGYASGKKCNVINDDGSNNLYCNDSIVRKATWTGLVALPYVSDWGYASNENECRSDLWAGAIKHTFDFTNSICKKNNWMHYGTIAVREETLWMLGSFARNEYASDVSVVRGDGLTYYGYVYIPRSVLPTLYLKSSIQISSGDGSIDNPYKLK